MYVVFPSVSIRHSGSWILTRNNNRRRLGGGILASTRAPTHQTPLHNLPIYKNNPLPIFTIPVLTPPSPFLPLSPSLPISPSLPMTLPHTAATMELVGLYGHPQKKTQNRRISALLWAITTKATSRVRTILQTERNSTIRIMSPPSNTTNARAELYPGRAPEWFNEDLVRFTQKWVSTLALHGGSRNWFTALHWSVATDDAGLLQMALRAGMKVDERDCFGYTALHLAVMKDDEVMVRTLLESGADVGAEMYGGTPLDGARRLYPWASGPAVVWLLLENGSDRCWKDRAGVPLLHLAVEFAHITLVEDLLDTCGEGGTANESVRDKDGNVEIRMATGAVDVNVRDSSGRTALHVAKKEGNQVLVEFLLRKGADPTIVDGLEERGNGRIAG